MALTVTKTVLKNYDPEDIVIRCEIAFDSSYPTGGEALDMTTHGDEILYAHVESHGLLGLVIDIDATNYASGALALMVLQGDYAKTADDELTEADNAADVSTAGAAVRVIVHMKRYG
jgi:hypothetical protein